MKHAFSKLKSVISYLLAYLFVCMLKDESILILSIKRKLVTVTVTKSKLSSCEDDTSKGDIV